MKAQDIEIGSRVQFEEYGSGTHNGTVLSVSGTSGAGMIEIGTIEPPLPSKATVRIMAAMLKPAATSPAPNPNAGKGNQSSIRSYVNGSREGSR